MTILSDVPDIRIVQNNEYPDYQVHLDWQVRDDGTLDDTHALATAIVVALGTNGLADANAILPDPDSNDRMGWWGDYDAQYIWSAWPIGSLLWLLRRSAIYSSEHPGGSTLAIVKNYIYSCIQPFVNARAISTFSVFVERVDTQRIDALIQIYRGPLLAIELRYQLLWNELQTAPAP
jgi:phage gp46-like protein